MDLELFAVSPSGRVALGDLLKGVEYTQAEKNADGTITLSPVTIRADEPTGDVE